MCAYALSPSLSPSLVHKLHICQLAINHAVQESSPITHQLRLQALLYERSDLLLGYVVEIYLSETALDCLHDHHVIGSIIVVCALEIEV